MNGIMNGSAFVKDFEFNKPLLHKIDSIIDNCIRDCNDNSFQTFAHICEYDINLTNISSDEIVYLTISEKNMVLYDLNENSKNAWESGFFKSNK